MSLLFAFGFSLIVSAMIGTMLTLGFCLITGTSFFSGFPARLIDVGIGAGMIGVAIALTGLILKGVLK